ncbi:hypothetical protein [Nocardioides limicola]|uniref:hypothetical protein n=1 Tax=Nocardioides limicola TaxID=2803368 RepID=UPI00193C3349|nr:hypothetical protein [Nocardioides sp. DJM-14]
MGFDDFYARTRSGLLLETYALTGDLPAARSAVREAYVVAWHHWRKVSRMPDPTDWVRSNAWHGASRRHTARIWHRDRSLDPDLKATFDALAELSSVERRMLMAKLTDVEIDFVAREVGLTRTVAMNTFEDAAARFALHRDIDRRDVSETLAALAGPVADVRLPRSTIIRRAGTRRRRTHTLVACGAVLAALVGTGVLVSGGEDARVVSLAADGAGTGPIALRAPQAERQPRLARRHLLTAEQMSRLAPRRTWRATSTTDNTLGDGIVLPCQRSRFADSEGRGSLVRTYRGGRSEGAPRIDGIEMIELSGSPAAAEEAYRTSINWYSACTAADVRVEAVHELSGVGNEAAVLVLRERNERQRVHTVAVARTGQMLVTVYRGAEDRNPASWAVATTLSAGVNRLCGVHGADACGGPAELVEVDPYPAGAYPGLLATVDLPPIQGVTQPWVGTEAREAVLNVASTRCDRARFDRPAMSDNLTRSFLVPEAPRLPETFGLTQTIATMPNARRASAFVAEIRQRMAGCGSEELTVDVRRIAQRDSGRTQLSVWEVAIEVSEDETVNFLMAFGRRGKDVVQIGFVPAPRATIADRAFVDLAERALVRLSQRDAGS